jgi:methyltransferase (TIGR00027 family)
MAAAARAYYSAQSGHKIFDDSLAHSLLSDGECERFEEICVSSLQRLNPSLSLSCSDRATFIHHVQRLGAGAAPLLVRGRYIEDALGEALNAGIQQYVILGAGLDTFAFRRPDVGDRLQIFEVDHPASQAFKRRRLERAGLNPPPYLHFAAADLERESVAEALDRTPYKRQAPTFFAWPGVAMYLSHEAVFKTLRCIAGLAAYQSELVFDYFEPGAFRADAPLRLRLMLQLVQTYGEAMRSGLDPLTLQSELSDVGLELLEDLGPVEVQRRFLDQSDGFQATEYWHLARAGIPGLPQRSG